MYKINLSNLYFISHILGFLSSSNDHGFLVSKQVSCHPLGQAKF